MQFASLADLRDRWRGEGIAAAALGLNQIGQEAGVADYCAGLPVPLLQDVPESRVMQRYGIVKDDLLLLDPEGVLRKRVPTSQLGFHLLREAAGDSLVAWLRALS
ncbi:MAG: hypothetical protein GF346_12795 [Candidatus Eisenbacteria bacterium]|nr:hypothetical protein [Candidatus Latescibacterota bacterium]MBD3303315.1 hypothetical protein [Candidatus Eisenbacteria bacterium]